MIGKKKLYFQCFNNNFDIFSPNDSSLTEVVKLALHQTASHLDILFLQNDMYWLYMHQIQIIMLHELLMSLLGKPGSIIKLIGQQFKVDPSASILTASEANMINEICQTGYYYAQLTVFIQAELTQSGFLDLKKNASVYRKAMAQGLRRALSQYEGLVLSIQSDYLEYRHFTFSSIRAETTRFECIMKQMWQLVQRITSEKYKGGVVIDILWETFQNANQWFKQWIVIVLKECQKVFVSQVIGWVVHGQIIDTEGEFFIHRVVQEPEEKFKFSSRNIELTGWDIFTLDTELIPLSLITAQTAGKILFIGKSVKILRSSGKISSIPSSSILSELQLILQRDYCQIQFESTIQRIRHSIAQEMIKLIIGEQNLLRELQKINDYYLMLKGDFYHHFLEEVKAIENIAQKQRLHRKINQNCLQNTFIRLNCMQDAKRVHFELKQIGFSYIGFKNFLNLCPVGNIDLLEGKYVRFSASGGALWHRSKQIVENNFTVLFSVSFKKNRGVFKTRKVELSERKSNIISLVIQNSKDISPSFHQNPSSLAKINEYIAINVGYRYSETEKNYQSFAEVTYRNQKRCSKEVLLQPCPLKKINFLDETAYMVKVSYTNDEIKIAINSAKGVEGGEQTFKVDSIRMSNYLNLQMSRANIGLISNIQDCDCQGEIEQWQMICKPINISGDYWSELALNLKMSWPINLILTPDLMEVFSRINKFLFPLRKIQIQLEQIWIKIPRRIKEEKHRIVNITQSREIDMFQRKLTALRWRMNLVISNLWSYFQADVIQSAWPKLKQSIMACDDLEFIRMINKYVDTIQTMYYFNAVKIQRCIHEIVRQCRNFVILFQKLSAEIIDEHTYKEFENISDHFGKNVGDFYKLLKDLSKTSNSTHLFHLTQRMQGCVDRENTYF